MSTWKLANSTKYISEISLEDDVADNKVSVLVKLFKLVKLFVKFFGKLFIL